ncbi:MAG TPA: archaellin/type IV pilin N-terminal domain-containing protein [Bacillota bacterium]|nr:archaellin/type IV pilin N-terminal domain-containing protein [Bacillota bacterium]
MKRYKKRDKKGVSPVIATVLLIAMAIIIGLIIFLWFRGLTQEAITKFERNIELVCEDVEFISSYSLTLGKLAFENSGNVPVYDFNIKVSEEGGHRTLNLKEIDSSWPSVGLRQGGTFLSKDLNTEFSGATEILIIPILAGTSQSGEEKTHVCDEQYGYLYEI